MSSHALLPATRLLAAVYLALLPVGHLVRVPVAGTEAVGTDLLLGLLVGVFALEVSGRGRAVRDRVHAPEEVRIRRMVSGLAALAGLGLWMALSGSWGHHAGYALAKGAGVAALAVGSMAIVLSGLGWRGVVGAWLAGAALALALTAAVALVGPEALRDRMLHGAIGVEGVPFPRVPGPFPYANAFGDYLLVTALLLGGWVAEDPAPARGRVGLVALAPAIAVALFFTFSTAWIAAGVVLAVGGGALLARGRRAVGALGVLLGLGLSGTTAILALRPIEVSILGLDLVTNGIRPGQWAGAVSAFVEAPLLGVGAAPYLAEVADPLQGGRLVLWDAHNAYLSVAGQFGVVGVALAALGGGLILRAVFGRGGRELAPPRAWVLGLAFAAAAVHGLFLAGEELRHLWALLGVAGAAVAGEGA